MHVGLQCIASITFVSFIMGECILLRKYCYEQRIVVLIHFCLILTKIGMH
jgi:hypothetical protein